MTQCRNCYRGGRGVIILSDGVCLTCRAFESDHDDLQEAEVAILKGEGWPDERIGRARTMGWIDLDEHLDDDSDSIGMDSNADAVDSREVEPETPDKQAQLSDW